MVNNMNINEENNGSTNNGGKGRFFERLKKIQRDKHKKKTLDFDDFRKNEKIKSDNRKILKPFLIVSSFFLGAIKSDNKKQEQKENISNDINNVNIVNYNKQNYNSKEIKETKIIDRKNTGKYNKNVIENSIIKMDNDGSKDYKIQNLQIEIINLIKKRLVKTINELEILQSELYVLKEVTGEDIYLNDCTEKIKEVKKLLSKIKNLKEKYDYLKNNIDFDSLLETSNDSLVDKIIELKDLCSSEDIKNTIQNYKILEEYKYLYLKIDKLEEEVIKFDEYKKNKEEELKNRDIDFEKFKNEFYDKELEQGRYNNFIKEQENFLQNLNEKILNISSKEVVNYRIKGFNQLLGNSFKYLGLLLASPLKGLFPSIAMQTVATRNVIHNLYNNLEWEEERKIVYEAIDFSLSIHTAIDEFDKTLNLIGVTLNDIKNLKSRYMEKFAKYEHSFSNYSEIIKKINKMENAILNNKIKIELMKEKMYEKEKENDSKIKRVKKLNSSME